MSSPNRQSKPYTYRTEQEIANKSFDEQYQVETVVPLLYRGDLDAFVPDDIAPTVRFDIEGTTIYVGQATIGTADSTSSGWTIYKFNLSDLTNASGKVATNVSWNNRAVGSYN